MKCPVCENETSVVDSRISKDGKRIRRRRQCQNPKCKERFTTYEVFDETLKDLPSSSVKTMVVALTHLISLLPREAQEDVVERINTNSR